MKTSVCLDESLLCWCVNNRMDKQTKQMRSHSVICDLIKWFSSKSILELMFSRKGTNLPTHVTESYCEHIVSLIFTSSAEVTLHIKVLMHSKDIFN